MTIEDAMISLEEERRDHHSLPTDRTGQALQLGFEALALLKKSRGGYKNPYNRKLPSETEY